MNSNFNDQYGDIISNTHMLFTGMFNSITAKTKQTVRDIQSNPTVQNVVCKVANKSKIIAINIADTVSNKANQLSTKLKTYNLENTSNRSVDKETQVSDADLGIDETINMVYNESKQNKDSENNNNNKDNEDNENKNTKSTNTTNTSNTTKNDKENMEEHPTYGYYE